MDNVNVKYTGPGFFTLLQLLFIGLKLTGYVDWDWWLVLSPLWVGGVLWVLVMVACVVIIAIGNNRRRPW